MHWRKIIGRVHETFTGAKLKLSAAESCTGGLIAHYLTMLPGSSAFFEAGVVAYSAASKKTILKVPAKTVAARGVVSREAAKIMAERVRLLTKTDYAVSTTGNLGPDLLEHKEKGLIFIGVSRKGGTVVRELRLRGTREQIKKKAALAALEFLLEATPHGR
jgi:nicotinamide-nucleotide amidase